MKVLSKDIMPFVKDMLELGKSVEFKVSGNSMLPFFKHHETTVHITRKPKYKKNDVILYLSNDNFILHRIYLVKKDYFIVYGDALKQKEIVYPKQVLGYVDYYKNQNKKINSNSKLYLFKVRIWKLCKPIRKLLLIIMKKVKLI